MRDVLIQPCPKPNHCIDECLHHTVYVYVITYPCPNLDAGLVLYVSEKDSWHAESVAQPQTAGKMPNVTVVQGV